MNAIATSKQTKDSRSITRPKRPLSAFNLFYRYKRQKLLQALLPPNNSKDMNKDAICTLVNTPPGLENYPSGDYAFRRQAIRDELEPNMNARDTRTRSHRKNNAMNGAMSFVELGRVMNDAWKSCDGYAKEVFGDLAEEGRDRYRARVAEYNEQNMSVGMNKALVVMRQQIKFTPDLTPIQKLSRAGTKQIMPIKKLTNTEMKKIMREQVKKSTPIVSTTKKRQVQHKSTTKKKLPTKRNKVSSPTPQKSDDGEMNDLAKTILELKNLPTPEETNKSKPRSTAPVNTGPSSLLDLLSSKRDAVPPPRAVADHSSIAPTATIPGLTQALLMRRTTSIPTRFDSTLPRAPLPQFVHPSVNTHRTTPAPITATATLPPPGTATAPVSEYTMLAARLKSLESQLAAERMQSRIRLLEDEMASRRAREDILRSVLDNVIAHNRAAAAASVSAPVTATPLAPTPTAIPTALTALQHPPPRPLAQDGLWSLMMASMLDPSVQAQHTRSGMLSRIVEQPSVITQANSSNANTANTTSTATPAKKTVAHFKKPSAAKKTSKKRGWAFESKAGGYLSRKRSKLARAEAPIVFASESSTKKKTKKKKPRLG